MIRDSAGPELPVVVPTPAHHGPGALQRAGVIVAAGEGDDTKHSGDPYRHPARPARAVTELTRAVVAPAGDAPVRQHGARVLHAADDLRRPGADEHPSRVFGGARR